MKGLCMLQFWRSKRKAATAPSESQPERLKEYELEFALRGFLAVEPTNVEMMAKAMFNSYGHRNIKRLFRLLLQRSDELKKHRGLGSDRAVHESMLESLSAEESDGTEFGKLMSRGEHLKRLIGAGQTLESELFDPDNGINWLVELAEDRIGLSAKGAEDAIFGLLAVVEALVPKDQAERFISSIRGAPDRLMQHKAAGYAVFGINASWIEHSLFSRGISENQAKRLANLILEFVAKQSPDVAIAVEVQMRGKHPLFSFPDLGTHAITR